MGTSSNSYYKPDAYIDQLVKRSASSVNAKNRAPIAKPVRRSKSTKNPRNSQNFVTSIQHGGSVTLVSLNGDSTGSNSTSESEVKHVHHHHFVQDPGLGQVGSIGFSQTLPRKGSKKVEVKPSAHDDSDVVIKKQGLNGVKIRLNLNQIEQSISPPSYSDRSGGESSSNTSKDGDDLDHEHSPGPPVTHLDEADHYYLQS